MSAPQEGKQLLRSCEPCRSSKIRCKPDVTSQSKCQRCEKLGKHCVYAEVKPRTRNSGVSNARRVQDLEKKIDRLSSLLQKAPSNADDSATSPTVSGPVFDAAPSAQGNIDQLGVQLTPPDSQSG